MRRPWRKLGQDADANNRVRVRYENGLVLTANGASNTWAVGSWLLPDLGWVAEGAGITAGTTLRDGVVTDFADAGAQPVSQCAGGARTGISRVTAAFTRASPRSSKPARALSASPIAGRCRSAWPRITAPSFISAPTASSAPSRTTRFRRRRSQWQVGQAISDGPWNVTLSGSLPDGDYDWLIGLFDAAGDGSRVHLQGVDDGTSRIRLGSAAPGQRRHGAHVHRRNQRARFRPDRLVRPASEQLERVVDFGVARTDGSAWLRREGNLWRLKTWPRERNFTLELSSQRFDQPAKVQCVGGTAAQVTPVPAGSRWRLPLNGASEYRWTNSPPRLSIIRSNAAVVVSWPASAAGFTLEAAADLASPAAWNALTNPVLNANGGLSVILSPAESHQFHRLKLPQ